MGDSESSTLQSQHVAALIDRLHRGDNRAREELVCHVSGRLERIVRKRLRGFPLVARWEQTGDVLQAVLLRLCRALEGVALRDARHLFAISSHLIRRELIDLKRHHYGPEGAGAHHATRPAGALEDSGGEAEGVDAPGADHSGTVTLDPAALAQWTDFHQQVERLPEELREVVDLLWYQELSQDEAANLLGVSSKTIRRRWREAKLALADSLPE